MFHVPGTYSGASTDAFTWTQTKDIIELNIPLAADVRGDVVYGARSLRVVNAGADAPPLFDGALYDVIVADESHWMRDETPRQLHVTLRKSVPGVWPRLLTADADLDPPPQLLDGMKRKGEKAAAATDADADAPADASGAAAKKKGAMPQSNAKPHILQSLCDVTVTLEPTDLPPVAVLLLRDCVRCTVELPASATVVKVSADSCEALTLCLRGKVTTETLEAYKCARLSVRTQTELRTVQLDNCGEVALRFDTLACFERVVQSGVQSVRATFDDTPALTLATTADSLAAASLEPSAPEYCAGLPAGTEQFISRLATPTPSAPGLAAAPGLVTEHVRRLANEFPSTLREAREHADRTRVRVGALGGGLGGATAALLEGAAGAVSDEEKARLRELAAAAEAEAAAAEAAAHAAADAATELATRVEAKKAAGNRAHAEGDFHEAAVRYTEAIALADSAPAGARAAGSAADATAVALRANRAAAFLKLGRYEQALADCDVALAAQPEHAKAAFRRGLALQALERYGESIAAFAKAHALEPANGHVTAALRMAEMQVRRQRAQG